MFRDHHPYTVRSKHFFYDGVKFHCSFIFSIRKEEKKSNGTWIVSLLSGSMTIKDFIIARRTFKIVTMEMLRN